MSCANMTYSLDDLLVIMQRLRDPDSGCPWDLKQTFQSIVASTLEESYELVDAIEREDYPHVREELGDLLFQVVFYCQLGQEQQLFDFPGVVDVLSQKLIRRHPHVFPAGDLQEAPGVSETLSQAQLKQRWEEMKQVERKEKQLTGLMDDVPQGLPAATRAVKLQKRASSVGFDWPDWQSVLPKIDEERLELQEALEEGDRHHIEHELGDLMFALTNLARKLQLDPETCLRKSNQRFESRFAFIESALEAQGRSVTEASLIVMDDLWDQAKKALAQSAD
jgi:ATP diphosphatase